MNSTKIKRQMGWKILVSLVTIWLFTALFAEAGSIRARADERKKNLELYLGQEMEKRPFAVGNMFPGDTKTKDYCLRVTHEGQVAVNFQVNIRPDEAYGKLAEVLRMKVQIGDREVYDGRMSEMKEPLCVLTAASGRVVQEKIDYSVTAYLDTDVGNEYQGKALVADFVWWAESEAPAPGKSSGDGDETTQNWMTGVGDDMAGDWLEGSDEAPELPGKSGTGGRLAVLPRTGDRMTGVIGGVLGVVCILGFLLLKRKGTATAAAVILLAAGFLMTSFALIRVSQEVKENEFQTGTVKLNINDGLPVIDADDLEEEFRRLEPGMQVRKTFFVENLSSGPVYYRVYLDKVEGTLAEILDIRIQDGETVLCCGKARELTRSAVLEKGELGTGENARKELTIWFIYPKEAGNETQDRSMTFELCADAVQMKNNPDRRFR